MEMTAQEIGGKIIRFRPLSVTVNRDYSVPADSAVVYLAYSADIEELKSVEISEGGEVIFSGGTDVFEREFTQSGSYIRIEARNIAGAMLSSEAKPTVYRAVSADIIFENHIKPFGAKGYFGEDRWLDGDFTVTKGMSEWQVVREFCKKRFLSYPYFDPDGTVYFEPKRESECARISFGRCTSVKEKRRRCSLVSKVFLKSENEQDYKSFLQSDLALEKDVGSVRYMDVSQTKLTPLECADELLRLTDEEYYSLEVVCPEYVGLYPGQAAKIDDERIDTDGGLFVQSVEYRFTNGSVRTKAVLKRRVRDFVDY